jgi:flagellar biosynthetic protein FlhB
MSFDNKTEKPTPRRRQKAREKGQVARSRELAGTAGMLAALLVIAKKLYKSSGTRQERSAI